MACEKLQALTKFIIEQNFVGKNKIDSWAEDFTLNSMAVKLGNGVRFCTTRYGAVISIEKFKGNADLLIAQISVWLMENDESRERDELAEPTMEIDVINGRVADLMISIEFCEYVDAVLDPQGPITYEGVGYSLAPIDVDNADEGEVSHDASNSADKGYHYED